MQQDAFEAELKTNGFTDIEMKSLAPRPANTGHAHDYDIRGLVLSGTFIVISDGKGATHHAGDIFAVPAGTSHQEEIGADGARILVGKKY